MPRKTSTYGVRPISEDFVKVYESPDPAKIYAYSPGIACLPSGRLIATLDISGPGMDDIPGPKAIIEWGRVWQGKVFTSDDKGDTWTHRVDFPFMHARPFVAGKRVYVLGQADDLVIIRSDDDGETWSEPVFLTDEGFSSKQTPEKGTIWHQAPSNVHYANGCVYLVMEKRIYGDIEGWNVNGMAPILMRGRLDSDLTKRENWVFASELAFRDAVAVDRLDYFGVPFFHTPPKAGVDVAPGRGCTPIGWLETNVVQFTDPNHYWYDPRGKTFHLWARAHTGGTGYAAIAKVIENANGSMSTMVETVPSGKKVVFVPCPGGQMKFHILYDEVSRLFWLLSSQATDSMIRAECLPPDRFNLPNNERHRLQLHFSKNCIDWCFAGIVSMGSSYRESRHYASMITDGDDLYVLSRSGDERARSAHDGNFISFHKIRDFRELIY
jgi:hypothetical protein